MWGDDAHQIFAVFAKAGHQCYVVGGAVRDHLMKIPIKDIDFSVSCPPETSLDILEAANIRTVKTGFEHGTITAIIGDTSFEITSFRQDIQTDGRHAIVQFGGEIEADAIRRDFTINAIYMDDRDEILDPVAGLDDLEKRHLRFVGIAAQRVTEDYLRILRFFRFYSLYHFSLDPAAINAIRKNVEGLRHISPERIGHEMRKLLMGNQLPEALSLMRNVGIDPPILPDFDIARLKIWRNYSQKHKIRRDWRMELIAITDETPRAVWRLTNQECKWLERVRNAVDLDVSVLVMGQLFGSELGWWILHYRAAMHHHVVPEDAPRLLSLGEQACFPISGKDLEPILSPGPMMGAIKDELYQAWLDANFRMGKSDLLGLARKIIERAN